jgi:hypothetical protein
MLTKILISCLAILGLATFGIAPVIVQGQSNPPIPNFKCGPGLMIYRAKSYNASGAVIGEGMRCVKTTSYTLGQISFAWYGEGFEANCNYRILGHAIYGGFNNPPTNTIAVHKTGAADIWGNGECRQGNYNGSLVAYSDPGYNTIKIQGALTELWTKVTSLNYTPMNRPAICGNTTGLTQYKAIDGVGGSAKAGVGIRCVLNFYFPNMTWFGNGWWYNPAWTYTELGTTKSPLLYGSSTIIGNVYGVFNILRAYGSFPIVWGLGIANVGVPKDEYWY